MYDMFDDPSDRAYAINAAEGSRILAKAFCRGRVHPSRKDEVLIKCMRCPANRVVYQPCICCGAKPGPLG